MFGGYPDNGSGLNGFECGDSLVHQRREVFVVIALCPQQDDRQVKLNEVLLMWYSFVRGEEGVELFLGEPEKFPIPLAGPASTADSLCLYLLPKEPCKPTRQILVKQDPHRR